VRWLELTVEVDVEAVEPVSEIFGRLGRGAAVRPTRLIRDPNDELSAREDPTAPYEITAHLPEDDAAPAAVEATERALWHLQAFGLRPVGRLRVRSVDESDWAEAWKRDYVPQRIGRVVIVPSWLEEPIAPDEVALRLDPGMAFGTGLHPTTRGCLMLLQGVLPMPARCLDVGSGSGILALAALRLGAQRADCLDTDPVAVEATLANAAANGLGERVAALVGTLPPKPAGEPTRWCWPTWWLRCSSSWPNLSRRTPLPAEYCWPAGSSRGARMRSCPRSRPPVSSSRSASTTVSGSRSA